jgi:hypothetical protein
VKKSSCGVFVVSFRFPLGSNELGEGRAQQFIDQSSEGDVALSREGSNRLPRGRAKSNADELPRLGQALEASMCTQWTSSLLLRSGWNFSDGNEGRATRLPSQVDCRGSFYSELPEALPQ